MTRENEEARERIAQVFRYLHDLNIHRNPAKRQLQDQPWRLLLDDLPDHPSIHRVTVDISPEIPANDAQAASYLLKVERPSLSKPPEPPDVLADWLERGWDDPFAEPNTRAFRNEINPDGDTIIVGFEESSQRVAGFDEWAPRRAQWAEAERPARLAMNVFEELYELRGRIDREGESLELMLGDGMLDWPRPDGRIHHPVLLQRVELSFDTAGPSFTIVETERGPELYSALLHTLPELDTKAVARWQAAMGQDNYHPLAVKTTAFLRHIVAQLGARGEFVDAGPIRGDGDRPCVGRSPVLFLRHRVQGFAAAIDAVLEDLETREDLPKPLVGIVGIDPHFDRTDGESVEPAEPSVYPEEEPEALLSKPANAEQIRIIQRLERSAGVLVQGPPGTGKSHTIANLIGHLLAQGKTVLVTAHTTKALRVLRQYVVDTLQPLCVSVLDNDLEGRRQLEQSVEGIVERLSGADPGRLRSQVRDLTERRADLLRRIRAARQALFRIRQGEYQAIVVGGDVFDPSDAARTVTRGRDVHAWIPSPVVLGSSLPLPEASLAELYRTNVSVPLEDEREIADPLLPDPATLMTPSAFAGLVAERDALAVDDRSSGAEYWARPVAQAGTDDLDELAERLADAVAVLGTGEAWRLEIIAAAQRGGPHRTPWDSLLSLIEEVSTQAAEAQETLLRYGPSLSGEFAPDEIERVAGEIVRHLEIGRGLGRVALLTRPAWKRLLEVSRVGGRQPHLPEHFEALRIFSNLQRRREELVTRWRRQMEPLGASALDGPDAPPERAAEQWTGLIQECLAWQSKTWVPLERELIGYGFRWEAFLAVRPVNSAPAGDLLRLRDAVSGPLLAALAARARAIRWNAIDAALHGLRTKLESPGRDDDMGSTVGKLRSAVDRLDGLAYERALERLVDLWGRRGDMERRRELLEELTKVAPAWATDIEQRTGVHGAGVVPGDAAQAWLWRQLHEELDHRGRLSLDAVERELASLVTQLQHATADLIDLRAWVAQTGRVSLQQRQSLIGWADTVRRIGRGTGARAPQLRARAVELMNECRSAVPVWVMPLARVVEQFDPRTTRFDVVIIDEASQSDVMALVACYLGRRVVVVGDHEQVSPLAVGQDLNVVERLIRTHLDGIPNSHLYDGRMSVYDLARQSFGQTIVLVEHFRCVPDIIQFSNGLSYSGRIRPLRDATSVLLKPHVVPFRVEASDFGRDVNHDEARTIASLMAAAIEQPEYEKKTFGVITLVGEAQALEIERLVRQSLPVTEIEQRRIVCGNAAHFQGDERDVMFLSVVDVPQGGPLALRQDDRFKQRYNVAASRARDQMWVIYSLDPRLDLKAGDLRRELIEHAQDPSVRTRALQQVERRAESELERQVAQRLIQLNYRVRPQWQVGHYRIDLVVEGAGRRLAIECDGDRWHPPEKLADDLERQAILQRLGWRFARVRGTQFFRDPDRALDGVFEAIERLKIPAEGPVPDGEQSVVDRVLIDRVRARAEALRREWLENGFDRQEEAIPEETTHFSAELTAAGQRVIEALRMAGRPLGKSQLLDRASLSEAAWWSTIRELRQRGLVVLDGSRRGATYRLASTK